MDREIDPIGVRRTVVGAPANELVGKVVESAHQVLDSIASNERDGCWNRHDTGQIIDQPSRLRVALGPDFVRVDLEKVANLGISVCDVLFGPFDFRPDLS